MDNNIEKINEDIKMADLGDSAAQARVGNYYYYGQYVEPDIQKAMYYYTRSAEQGDPDGQYALAYCCKCSETPDFQKAFYWFLKAAEQGFAPAQYELGCCYYYGEGTAEDCIKAFKWIEKSSDQGYAPAEYQLGLFYYDPESVENVVATDRLLAARLAFKSASKNFVPAQLLAGYFCENGIGVQQDYSAAVSWYQKAADAGHDGALLNLGICYAFGRGVEKNTEKAIELYEKSAQAGNSSAMFNLATLYQCGTDIQQDYSKALYWYSQAAEMKHTKAMVSLGSLYYTGDGVEQNYEKAFNLFLSAAQDNNVDAWIMLGKSYLLGRGTNPNYSEALKLFQKAAEQDEPEAFYYIGRCYSEGKGAPQNDGIAYEYYKKAADKGLEAAVEIINSSASQPKKSEIDMLTEKFNNENSADAALALGCIYMSPELANKNGVKTDFNKACDYFEASARLGNTTAMEQFAQFTLEISKKTLKTNPESADFIIQDLKDAIAWAEIRTSRGLSMSANFYNEAYLTLGCAYSWLVIFGKDIEENCILSVECFRNVSDFGSDYFAMFRYIYTASKLHVDLEAQFKYEKIIADYGKDRFDPHYYPLILYMLSNSYLYGFGCEKDIDEAYKYAVLAGQAGYDCGNYISRFQRKFNGHYRFIE